MDYREAAAQARRYAMQSGQPLFLDSYQRAKFFSLWAPAMLQPSQNYPDGDRALPEIPGIFYDMPVFTNSGTPLFSPTSDFPGVLLGDWDLFSIRQYLGERNAIYVEEMTALYESRILGRQIILAEDERLIRAAMRCGIVPRLVVSESRSNKWNQIADELRRIRRGWFDADLALLKKERLAIENDITFWDNIYKVTEAVASAPAKAAEAAADAAKTVAVKMPWWVWPTGLLLGAAALGFKPLQFLKKGKA